MAKVRRNPCPSCPYRRDVPSGVWAESEYAKLEDYDRPTADQPWAAFMCHSKPEQFCCGWAVCHTSRGHENDLLALRLEPIDGALPTTSVPLFASGAEAAAHGRKGIARPSKAAQQVVGKLLRYPRLKPKPKRVPFDWGNTHPNADCEHNRITVPLGRMQTGGAAVIFCADCGTRIPDATFVEGKHAKAI